MSNLFAYAIIALFLDQWSKRAVLKHLTGVVSWGTILHIRPVCHTEKSYKKATLRLALVFVWCLAMVSAAWLHGSGLWLQSRIAVLGVGCALGGAAGNLADILRLRYIVDFIDLGWWPVFNLADVAIVGGVALAFTR